tara:strand:+ start:171 stop:1643 length:1473 start_codon:yes stop_codon:yes gene_type:complete
MVINNWKRYDIYNLLFCLIFSAIIFLLFNNSTLFNNLLGETGLEDNGTMPKLETCYVYFCRTAAIPFLYYFLINSISIDFIIFIQIFLLVSISFLIRIKLIRLNLNTWMANFLFLLLVVNPKFLKYSFSTQEESLYVPALLLSISTLIGFILKKNIKNLMYLNLAFALLVLIRQSGVIFYFFAILINIYYLINIDNLDYKKKMLLTMIVFFILISPQVINKNLTNYLNPEKINNHYFSMHAISSLISKQENYLGDNDDSLSRYIDNRISKLNNIRGIENLDGIKKLNFECVIFPIMNNLSYMHPSIINFYENNYKKDLNKKSFVLYVKNILKSPNSFLIKFNQCFFANFLIVEILTKEEFVEMKKISRNLIFDYDDKKIIDKFHKISTSYFSVIKPIRIMNITIFVITIISVIISFKSLLQNKKDKFAILSILFFCMYYLVMNLHANLISAQARWFFTYYPLLIFSNLKIIELIDLFFTKKKNLNFKLKN